jgi:hypothetical protein
MGKAGNHWIVTGSFTADGAVAYWGADGSFKRTLIEAQIFDSKEAAEAVLKTAVQAERIVCDPYLTEVGVAPQGLDALSARERIRAEGPTIRVRRPDPSRAAGQPGH